MTKIAWSFKPDSNVSLYSNTLELGTSNQHLRVFKALVNYLVKLRRDGNIDNNTFDSLVRQAAGSFIEAEVSGRIGRVLEDKISERIDGIFDDNMMVSHFFGGVSGRLSK